MPQSQLPLCTCTAAICRSVSLGTQTCFGDETGSVTKAVQLHSTPLPHLKTHHHFSGAQQWRERTLQVPGKHCRQRVSPWARFTYVDRTGSASPMSDGESGLPKPALGENTQKQSSMPKWLFPLSKFNSAQPHCSVGFPAGSDSKESA